MTATQKLENKKYKSIRYNLPAIINALQSSGAQNKQRVIEAVDSGNSQAVGDAVLAIIDASKKADAKAYVDAAVRSGSIPIADILILVDVD